MRLSLPLPNNMSSNLPLLLLLQRPSPHPLPEIASAPEKVEDLPSEELGSSLGTDLGGNLGKYSTRLISRLVGGKMPGGFNASAVKFYLAKTWGLGPLRSDGVLLLATTFEPPKHFTSEVEAKS